MRWARRHHWPEGRIQVIDGQSERGMRGLNCCLEIQVRFLSTKYSKFTPLRNYCIIWYDTFYTLSQGNRDDAFTTIYTPVNSLLLQFYILQSHSNIPRIPPVLPFV